MKRYKEILQNISLMIVGVAIFFLLAEIACRVIMPNSVKLRLMHKPDEKIGYRLVPHFEMEYKTKEFNSFIRINSEGLRDYEHDKDKDIQTIRILVLGDSFTFGYGVNIDESYPKILEAMLNQNLSNKNSKRFEVINTGVDGYGTEQEYLYLEELGPRYKPDFVIVGLYSSDVYDAKVGIPKSFKKAWLKNHFYFLSYLRGLWIQLSKTIGKDIRSTFQIYQNTYPPEIDTAYNKTKEYLVKIRDFSHSIGAKTLVVIIPFCFEVSRQEWEKRGLVHLYTDEFFNNNMGKVSEIFTGYGKEKEIPTLPLLPVFRKNKNLPLYFNYDPHWTNVGHRLAAEQIYIYLYKHGLQGVNAESRN